MLNSLLHDVRVTFRVLLKHRGFSAVTILTLALAIGANTAIFSVVDGVLLRPLPFPDEDQLVIPRAGLLPGIVENSEDGIVFSDRGYWHFVENNRVYDAFGGYSPRNAAVPLTGEGDAIQINAAQVSRAAFDVLGTLPAQGRLPTPEEDLPDAPLVVLLSHGLWTNQFGQSPDVIGRTIEVNGQQAEIIGIMPQGYNFPTPETEIYVPYRLDPASENFGGHHIEGIGRLAEGQTVESALADAEALIGRFGEIGYGESWFTGVFDGTAVVTPLKDQIVGDSRQPLLILLGTVGFVLLIACSNVANLLLVRAEGRTRESAVRMALGSGRPRLIQQVMTEAVMLSLIGGVLGIGVAWLATRTLVGAAPATLPRVDQIGVHGSALLFTTVVSVFAGLLFGLLPALRAGSKSSLVALRDGGRGSTAGRERLHVRNVLVVGQVALALVLLVGSGLMLRSFQQLRAVDPGFQSGGVLTFGLRPIVGNYGSPEAVVQFYDELIDRLEAIPSISRAGGITTLPLTGGGPFLTRIVEEFPPEEGEFPDAFHIRRATPGYFETMGIPVVEGRAFDRADHNDRLGTIVVSNALKERYWPSSSAIGKRITPATIVGVVGDVHDTGLDIEVEEIIYYPMLDSAGGGVAAMTLVARTDIDPLSVVPDVRRTISELDPMAPITDVRAMSDVVGDSLSRTTFTMWLIGLGAAIALFLGAVGIFGVISYVVSQQTAEIGVRLALGAEPRAVGRRVLTQAMKLTVLGILIGLGAAGAMGNVINALLYNVQPFDPATFVGGSVVFLVVAAVASLLPAYRAASVAPADALRAE